MKVLLATVPWLVLLGAVKAAEPATAAPQARAALSAADDDTDRPRERRTRPGDPDGEDAKTPASGSSPQGPGKSDEDEDQGKAPAGSGPLSLTVSQQEAVGLRVEAPRAITSAAQIEAYGTVLDPVALLSDAGRIDSTRAAAAAASADTARLQNLYHDGAQASLKSLQASQAQSIEADAQAQAAALAFRQSWGPLADLNATQRRTLIEGLGSGRRLLVRADVPGRHLSGAIGGEALIEVDGVAVTARVLGTLPRTDVQAQSTGWLLEVERAPPGFGPGARAPVQLKGATVKGLLVPAAALVYADRGAYVYRQVAGAKSGTFAYESVAVKPLARVGEGWVVEGLSHSDTVVVQGAGVLWSLQGISSFSAAEEEHD